MVYSGIFMQFVHLMHKIRTYYIKLLIRTVFHDQDKI